MTNPPAKPEPDRLPPKRGGTNPVGESTLCVFARYPRFGEGKTRLARTLGISRAHLLYRAMLLDSLDFFAEIEVPRRLVYWTGCTAEEAEGFLVENHLTPAWSAALQSGTDLGERMWRAAREVKPDPGAPGALVFLGADTPHLPTAYVRRALTELSRVPVVVGPSVDGGYYLLGLAELRKSLFKDIGWGTHRVLGQTLSRMRRGEYALLPRWYDIDSEADLEKVRFDPSVREGRLTGLLRSTAG